MFTIAAGIILAVIALKLIELVAYAIYLGR